MAAAHALARAGCSDVTIVERGPKLGGLAGSFEHDGHSYPLGYHHILHRDRTLLYFLDASARCRRSAGGGPHALSPGRSAPRPRLSDRLPALSDVARRQDALRAPDAARLPQDGLDGLDGRERRRAGRPLGGSRGAPGDLRAAGEAALRALLPGDQRRLARHAAALPRGLGPARVPARGELDHDPVHRLPGPAREARGPDPPRRAAGGAHACRRRGARGRARERRADRRGALREHAPGGGYRVALARRRGDAARRDPLHRDDLDGLRDTTPRGARLLLDESGVAAVTPPVESSCSARSTPRSARRARAASTSSPTCAGGTRPSSPAPTPSCWPPTARTIRRIFGAPLDPFWHRISRIPMYAPTFVRGYRNPTVRSASHSNLYFAGAYCSHPTVASTGTAMASGFLAARALLREMDADTDLPEAARSFRPASMPRA